MENEITKIDTKEYDMLRQEILQYLEEFQSIRNMMYIATGTILTICLNVNNTNTYAYLIPLIVVLPSYLVYFDYWEDVVRDTTYLMVFYEEKPCFPIKWETRLRKMNKENKYRVKRNYHKTPYIVCACLSIILYIAETISRRQEICQQGFPNDIYAHIIVGILLIIVCLCVFYSRKEIRDEDYIKKWKAVADQEMQEEASEIPETENI